MPTFAYLWVEIEDFINARESVKTVRKIVETWRKYGVKGELLVNELVAKNIRNLDPELVRMIRDLDLGINLHPHIHPVLEYARYRAIEGKTWDEAVEEAKKVFTWSVDVRTGELNPDKPGVIPMIEEIFGKKPKVFGIHYEHPLNPFPFGGPFAHALNLLGIKVLPKGLKEAIFNGLKTFTAESNRLHNFKSLESFLELTKTMRDRRHFISIHAHDFAFYLTRGNFNAAWRCGEIPEVPFTQPVKNAEEMKKEFEQYDRVIKFIADQDVRFVVSDDFYRFLPPQESLFKKEELVKAAEYLLLNWKFDRFAVRPPFYIDLNGLYLSLCDAFQAFTHALAYYHEYGSLPEEVKVREVLGPVDSKPILRRRRGVRRFLDGKSIIKATAEVSQKITDRIPSTIEVNGASINAAEFLYLMAQEILAVERLGGIKDAVFSASSISPAAFSESCSVIESVEAARIYITGRKFHNYIADFARRPNGWFCMLQYWTEKPCRIEVKL